MFKGGRRQELFSFQLTGVTKESLSTQTQTDLFLDLNTVATHPGMDYPVVPKDGDYVYGKFRALSAIQIPDRPISFKKPGVLEKAAPLLQNQTVYRDHNKVVDNWAGSVVGTEYDKGDDKMPAGINANVRIDAVQAPTIARGVLSEPPSVHSVSASVDFSWEPSHNFDKEYEFWRHLGDTIDGRRVEMVATEIHAFPELSMVFQGADPHAKRVAPPSLAAPVGTTMPPAEEVVEPTPDPNPHPEGRPDAGLSSRTGTDLGAVPYKSGTVTDDSWDASEAEKRIAKWASKDGSGSKDQVDWDKYRQGFAWYDSANKEDFGSYKLPHHDIHNNSLVVNKHGVMAAAAAVDGARSGWGEGDVAGIKSHLERHYHSWGEKAPWEDKNSLSLEGDSVTLRAALSKQLGIDPQSSEDAVLQTLQTVLSAQETSSNLATENAELKTENAELKIHADLGKQYIEDQRREAVRLFKLVEDSPSEDLVTVLNTCDLKTAQAYIALYSKKAEDKFPAKCHRCDSADFVSRQSSQQTDPMDQSQAKSQGGVDLHDLPTVRFH